MSDVEQGIRPERPMAVSSVASQMGICASPVSVAVVSILAFMTTAGYDYSVVQILAVSIPATGFGVLCAAIWSYRRGKDLDKDPRFQEFISDPENKKYVYGDTESLQGKSLPKEYYRAMFIFFAGILVISACYGYFFLPTYPSDLACIGFDRSGTTRIGKYILNHSFMIPGLIGVISGCCMGFVIAHIVF